MNAERLLALFDRVSEAPDAVPKLRRFVLDLAVRGKLVEQDPADEPAGELLGRIAVETMRLVRAGEIKRLDAQPEATPDDLSFDLPNGWAATRIATVAICLDYMRRPINGEERLKRIEGKRAEDLFPYFGATQQQGWIDEYLFDGDLVLLGEDGVPFFDALKPKAYLVTGKSWVNNHAHVFRAIYASNEFLVHYLNVFDYSGRVAGATRAKLNQSKAVDIPIALPPLAEQRRIVARVDELMTLCDQLEAARADREHRRDRLANATLNRISTPDTAFQADAQFALEVLPNLTSRTSQIHELRNSILNLAVHGKLVPQSLADEPAGEFLARLAGALPTANRRSPPSIKSLKPANVPFGCPPGWEWTTVQRILDRSREISYGVIKLGEEPKSGGTPILRCSDVKSGFIDLANVRKVSEAIESEYLRTRLSGGEVLVNIRGTLGGVAKVPDAIMGYNVAREVAVVPVAKEISADFIVYVVRSQYFWDSIQENLRGIAYKGLNLGTLREFPIPLPPLAEQHRIVARVDELMALCDQLEASLAAADTANARLLDAILHEALNGPPQAEAA